MASRSIPLKVKRSFGETLRRDAWWLQPLLILLGLSAFVIYSTWAAFQNEHYWFTGGGANYLSPFYSPELIGGSTHAIFGPQPDWIPNWLPFSPAFLILWAPGGFRFTCYYYRGAYYKAFWGDPANCAVGEHRHSYWGERWFPLILQNSHRFFLYFALLFILLLAYDAWIAMWFDNPNGTQSFGIGVGTLVLTANVILLGCYTFGCHSLRHLIGGKNDEMSKKPISKKCYDCVSSLNIRHQLFAWLSLFSVGFSDLYVRLCSMGIWTDYRIF
ncbi:MAG: succinate dehydrogenase [Acidobacteriota bacterium]|nr:succinate dehydrogenase [Acidobacteriota bacterium]